MPVMLVCCAQRSCGPLPSCPVPLLNHASLSVFLYLALPPSSSPASLLSEDRIGHSGRLSHDAQPPVTESSASAGYQHNDEAAAAAAAEEQRQQQQQQVAEQHAAEQMAAEQMAAEQQAAEAAAMAEELLPGIEGLRILGDPVLGGKLTACGHSVNGTALCVFQVRGGEGRAGEKMGEGTREERVGEETSE